VRGGGKKPFRQKGTGRARAGSTRAPHWKGGGVVFAPKPRSYEQKLPRKVRQAALRSAWSDHVAAGTLLAVAPLLLAFLLFQRQFVQSFMRAGIK